MDQSKPGRPQTAVSTSPETEVSSAVSGPPSGLSEFALKRFISDSSPSPDDLEKVALSVLNVCSKCLISG